MNASDLKNLCAEARPVIERMMDDAETMSAFREAATNKGIDWSQVKALLKAQIRDERDGSEGKRVKALIEKADHATAYADLLGLVKMNEKNFSAPLPPPLVVIAEPAERPSVTPSSDDLTIPDFLRRQRVSA